VRTILVHYEQTGSVMAEVTAAQCRIRVTTVVLDNDVLCWVKDG
jgi:hypothetical protein